VIDGSPAQLVKAGTIRRREAKEETAGENRASTNPRAWFVTLYPSGSREIKDPAQVRRYIDKEICCPPLQIAVARR